MDLNNNLSLKNNKEKDDDEIFRTKNLVFWPLLRKISKEFLQNVRKFQIFHDGQSAIFLHQDGIFVYGDNSNGWFGLSTDRIHEYPMKIEQQIFDKEIQTIQIGSNFILLLTNLGYVYGCGNNSNGQIGLKNIYMVKQFTLIRNRIRFVKIACGSLHSLALDIDGNIWSWGDNEFNQCSQMSFKLILPTKLLSKIHKFHAKDIACGYTSSIMLNNDGNVFVWGRMASIYFKRPTLIKLKLKPDDFFEKVYGCRDICALQTNNGKIFHCFNQDKLLDFQQIEDNIQIISTNWNNNHIILYSKTERKCFVWNYDDPKLFATNSDSISDITNLYVHPNTPGLIRLPMNIDCNTDFNNPYCSDLELITAIDDGELPRTLYVQRSIILKKCEILLKHSIESPTNANRIMINNYPYSFLFQYLYFCYNDNYQTLWQINLNDNDDDDEYFQQRMLLQDLIAHYSLNDSLREKLENIIRERLNVENYIQIVSLMDKYQSNYPISSTSCSSSAIFSVNFFLYISIHNCGKFFEDALQYNQPKIIKKIFSLLYDFININYRYSEEKIEPKLCDYYKRELLDDNKVLLDLAIQYDPEKRDCIRFMNENMVTIILLQIYKCCFMYRRYDLIPAILKRIKFCLRKHLVNVFYFYLFSLDFESYGGLFNDNNHQYLHMLIVAFTRDPENFEINRQNFLDQVLVEMDSNTSITYFIKTKLFQLNNDFRWLESVIIFSGQETLLVPAIYCQFYSLAKQEHDENMLKSIRKHLSSKMFINSNTLPLIFLLALYYEDEQIKSFINKCLVNNLDEENISIIYRIVQTYIDDNKFIEYICKIFIQHINIFNCLQLYELIQQYQDLQTLTLLRPTFVENFNLINLNRFTELATTFDDRIILLHIEKFIQTNLNQRNGTDFYKLIMQNHKSFSNDFIKKFHNDIISKITSKNIIDFILASSNYLDEEFEEKLWQLANDRLSTINCLRLYELMIQRDFFDQCLQLKMANIIAKTLVNFENFERIYMLARKANDETLINELCSSVLKRILNKENYYQLYRLAIINSDNQMLKIIVQHLMKYLTMKNCIQIYQIAYKYNDLFVRQQCSRFLALNRNDQSLLSNDKQLNVQLQLDMEKFKN
ncbi:uncharacterized protein LOC113795704 [Dermatophagoides pteronyssinus]|uniref:uncharacterized protein LOC113795704 n=1 Tax=Dermatophagoides pteronyssinus TaxID=6956 RepID=UPI003F66C7C8